LLSGALRTILTFASVPGTIIAFEFGKNIISMKEEPKEGDGM